MFAETVTLYVEEQCYPLRERDTHTEKGREREKLGFKRRALFKTMASCLSGPK